MAESGDDSRAYAASAPTSRLCQGELLTNVVERLARWTGRSSEGDDEFGLDLNVHPYAVVVTQDCDLEQDANARGAEGSDEATDHKLLPTILLVVGSEFEVARYSGGSKVKQQVKQNKVERYQFLCAVPPEHDLEVVGTPSLVLDFKRLFTYPTAELLGSIARGETKRRARLITPYAEHVSSRFGYFAQRIGLPKDHHDFGQSAEQAKT